jgi:predicted enzyme related to lactoylglutathione lyase
MRLIVQRFSAMYDFYTRVLGLAPQGARREGPYEKLSFPRGEAALALHVRDAMSGFLQLSDADRAVLSIRVDDVDAEARSIEARGGQVLSPPASRFGNLRAAYLRDPEGNLIELQTW